MQDFRKLEVWKKARKLASDIYKVSMSFPKEEIYGLTSQIRRAVLSIPTNIAEGCGRCSGADLGRFLGIAMGSACELESLLIIGMDVGVLLRSDAKTLGTQTQEIKRMLAALIVQIRNASGKTDN